MWDFAVQGRSWGGRKGESDAKEEDGGGDSGASLEGAGNLG